jgi:hypothetical protein
MDIQMEVIVANTILVPLRASIDTGMVDILL